MRVSEAQPNNGLYPTRDNIILSTPEAWAGGRCPR
jgi:hypothetical protein